MGQLLVSTRKFISFFVLYLGFLSFFFFGLFNLHSLVFTITCSDDDNSDTKMHLKAHLLYVCTRVRLCLNIGHLNCWYFLHHLLRSMRFDCLTVLSLAVFFSSTFCLITRIVWIIFYLFLFVNVFFVYFYISLECDARFCGSIMRGVFLVLFFFFVSFHFWKLRRKKSCSANRQAAARWCHFCL